MIHEAAVEDIPALVSMGRKFFDASALRRTSTFDVGSFGASLMRYIDDDDALVLVAKEPRLVGIAAALVYPAWYNSDHVTGQELFWWVEPDRRGSALGLRLLDRIEAWAYSRGARSFSMGATETLKPESLTKFYARRGYHPSERLFTRTL